MNQSRRLLAGLLISIGLITNPFALAWVFSGDGQITKSVSVLFILTFQAFCVALGLITFRFSKVLLTNLTLISVGIWIALATTIGVDRLYGSMVMSEVRNYVFPAFSKVNYSTSEFQTSVEINNLGFRGPQTTISKNKRRVVVLGDSFTFGWGIDFHETWLSILAKHYPSIEFINLGKGGTHPGDHTQTLYKVVEELKPDLVISCVLQGNDLIQINRVVKAKEGGVSSWIKKLSEPSRIQNEIRSIIGIAYPHLSVRFRYGADIQNKWVKDAHAILESLSNKQIADYGKINSEIRQLFEAGQLNPSTIYDALRSPNQYKVSSDTSNTGNIKAIQYMSDLLLEMKTICSQNNAEFLVVAIPTRPYGQTGSLETLAKFGYEVSGADTLDGLLPIALALDSTDITLIAPVLPNDYEKLFYVFDGHWNANGNRIFAKELKVQLDSLPEWKRFLTL